MKRIILLTTLLFLSFVCFAQDKPDFPNDIADTTAVKGSIAEQATEVYNTGQFELATEILTKAMNAQLANGTESSDLYYNLGNAYFRKGEIAKALLYYEKALLLSPGDRDIRHNIEYANTKIEDKILETDTFFISSWLLTTQNLFGSNTWTRIAIVCFFVLIGCFSLFFFSRAITIKKSVFYIGIVLTMLIVLGNVFAYKQKSKIENRNTGIMMAGSTIVRSSPNMGSKELFTLHSGTKVTITKEDRDWLEIEIADGNIGWIEKEQLEII